MGDKREERIRCLERMEKKEREGELERGANKMDMERWRTGMQLETCDQREGGMQCVGEQDVEESQGGAQPCMLMSHHCMLLWSVHRERSMMTFHVISAGTRPAEVGGEQSGSSPFENFSFALNY